MIKSFYGPPAAGPLKISTELYPEIVKAIKFFEKKHADPSLVKRLAAERVGITIKGLYLIINEAEKRA